MHIVKNSMWGKLIPIVNLGGKRYDRSTSREGNRKEREEQNARQGSKATMGVGENNQIKGAELGK